MILFFIMIITQKSTAAMAEILSIYCGFRAILFRGLNDSTNPIAMAIIN